MKLTQRKDGTYVVEDDEVGPYHVVSREVYAQCKYDIEEIKQYALEHPEDVVQDITETEEYQKQAKSDAMRLERNGLLSACDWTQVPDAPTDKAAWAAYRQALRDITQHPDWPNVDWPEAPK
jgi:hypothetical protein